MQSAVTIEGALPQSRSDWRERLGGYLPFIILIPSLIASFVYVFVFTGWTLYISLSNSSLLPSYDYVGFENYVSLWQNRRWNIAYTNLFVFGVLYVIGSMAIGLLLAILIDQRVRGEAVWRTIYLYPLAVSFVVTGTVWSWLFNPTSGIEFFVHRLGWTEFRVFAGPPTASSRSTPSSSPASGRPRASRWRCFWRGSARSTRI